MTMTMCLSSGDDHVTIKLTSLDMWSFHFPLNLFAHVYKQYTPFIECDGFIIRKMCMSQGRARLMYPADHLDLLMTWSRVQWSLMLIKSIFGITMSVVAKYLQFARTTLVKILKIHDIQRSVSLLIRPLRNIISLFKLVIVYMAIAVVQSMG